MKANYFLKAILLFILVVIILTVFLRMINAQEGFDDEAVIVAITALVAIILALPFAKGLKEAFKK